ncbi:hypothetical protein CAEBREN_00237 [Caenorhabditis brenneri]|uniref:Uncharacterized protein n=1 Tax=Caenorhabditis brenneri TaxID=135651 RepID=G0N2R6_CAEBE|nr:hypothetical protein CAEBREN_00237 [Caenorhabditis brenneri]
MKALTIILLFYGIGCMASKTIRGPSNIYYAENEDSVGGPRQKRSAPNSTAIAALQTIKDLNVIRFYKALRELYLDDGFDVKLKFNAAILTAPVIPDIVYEQVIKSLELTRWEIKRGDGSMKRIQGMIKLNEPDSLIREPWLMDLVMLIMENSVNPKNVAYSIRDLGVALMENGSTRTGPGSSPSSNPPPNNPPDSTGPRPSSSSITPSDPRISMPWETSLSPCPGKLLGSTLGTLSS